TEDIDFASSIDLGSQDKELEKLREDVTRLQHEADDARTKLSDAQSKLSGVQKDKQALEKELQRLQRLKTIFDEDPSSPEISNLDREQVERQLQDRQLELNERSDEADVLVQQTEDYRGELDELESAQQEAKIGPRIELIEPALTVAATRGTPAVRLRSPAEQTEIVGRVSAPAGLLTFNVNDQFEEVDQSGSFRVWVPVGNKETPVSLVAIDNKGRRTVIDFVITPPQLASAPAEPTPESTPIFPETGDIDFGSYHALVIGNDDYTRLPRLQTASKDARMVEATLREKYNFQTTLLLNADRHSILSALYQLGERMTEQDNLLIYYAGHGDLDRINDRGYWLPVNAEPGNAANWISNISITDLINTMTARHIMVIADSCYSGAMSRSAVPRVDVNMPPELREKWLRLMTKNKSRTVLTSGGLQPVLDEGGGTNSVFAQAFLTALRENDQIIEGYSVFRQISQTVTEKAAQLGIEQVPEYAPIKHAGHETGQFFFVPAA
ncbi:MAG: caspase family protein, partial [Acidobacteriota bacterium]|nr:caspase family protein [Acidobacteriota bacterium]